VKTYALKYETFLPTTLDNAWDFFCSPLNLAKITPAEMSFVVTSDYKQGDKIYAGMIITYRITPLPGVKMNWMTEITHVKEKAYFVDEQRFGPYALWHHQHHFKQAEGGVQMTDLLDYAIPYGFIGRAVNHLVVAGKIKSLFDYRQAAIEQLFGSKSK
jgi:ligand-binding SRPBCC domain-containing protein